MTLEAWIRCHLRERIVDAAVSIAIGALLYPVVGWLVAIIARRDLRAHP